MWCFIGSCFWEHFWPDNAAPVLRRKLEYFVLVSHLVNFFSMDIASLGFKVSINKLQPTEIRNYTILLSHLSLTHSLPIIRRFSFPINQDIIRGSTDRLFRPTMRTDVPQFVFLFYLSPPLFHILDIILFMTFAHNFSTYSQPNLDN